jgi:hypothetical protein
MRKNKDKVFISPTLVAIALQQKKKGDVISRFCYIMHKYFNANPDQKKEMKKDVDEAQKALNAWLKEMNVLIRQLRQEARLMRAEIKAKK